MTKWLLLELYNGGYLRNDRDLAYQWFSLLPVSEMFLVPSDLDGFLQNLHCAGGKDALDFMALDPVLMSQVSACVADGDLAAALTVLGEAHKRVLKADGLAKSFRNGGKA